VGSGRPGRGGAVNRRMKVLHLAAGNRWTGAAAPAFAEVESLRAAGVDAHYAYVGGYRLEAKLRPFPFAHPMIEKHQNPAAFLRSAGALTALVRREGIDVVHAHLTYDHWLARLVARRSGARLARTFHAHRVLRNEPLTRSLIGVTEHLFVINDTFAGAPVLRRREVVFTPPPLDHRQFHPDGGDVRAPYGLAPRTPLLTAIGKLSKNRGFEQVLATFAEVHREIPEARLMIIGHGEHRPALEQLAASLGVTDTVIWAGYHEEDLAEHYRAADLLLFTERGSDEGHRAVLEALGCGVPTVVAPIEGIHALLRGFEERLIAVNRSSTAIADRAIALLRSAREERQSLRAAVAAHSTQFGYDAAARRLLDAY
jgi:glycosyltransferase involved in cell wall biosynthesis